MSVCAALNSRLLKISSKDKETLKKDNKYENITKMDRYDEVYMHMVISR